jgi:hypothetical protein
MASVSHSFITLYSLVSSLVFRANATGPALDLSFTHLRMPDAEGGRVRSMRPHAGPALKALCLTSHADRLLDANSTSGQTGRMSRGRLHERRFAKWSRRCQPQTL